MSEAASSGRLNAWLSQRFPSFQHEGSAAILTRESAFESVRQFGAQVTHGLRLSSICCGTLSVKDLLARRVHWALTTKGERF